ncbi:MAG: hypothetical protein JWM87_791 [Candidatus Eremiobacteraeota bacterium]|nr:hypothetical protein [Candidatus Eremiobacteraeota bacterium]
MSSVATALPGEIARVEEIASQYEAIPPASQIALHAIIRPALERARAALRSGDAVAMVRAYADLQEITE